MLNGNTNINLNPARITKLLKYILQKIEQDAITKEDYTAMVTAGAIAPGQVIPAGTDFDTYVKTQLLTTFFPSFIAPSVNLSSSIGWSAREVGYTNNVGFTVTFNRGRINGLMNGSWNPSGFQDHRAGAATQYYNVWGYPSTSYFVASIFISPGVNPFSCNVDHAIGPQPTDSAGNPFGSPLAAGTIAASPARSIIGYRAFFYGHDLSSIDNASIRALTKGLNPVNNTQFTINIPAGADNVAFAYPASLRDVSSVIYVEGMNSEVKSAFGTPSIVQVSGENGHNPIDYKLFLMVPDEPFPLSSTYIVTI